MHNNSLGNIPPLHKINWAYLCKLYVSKVEDFLYFLYKIIELTILTECHTWLFFWPNSILVSKDMEFYSEHSELFILFQFKEGDIRPVHTDILIAKLRPGQVSTAFSGLIIMTSEFNLFKPSRLAYTYQ